MKNRSLIAFALAVAGPLAAKEAAVKKADLPPAVSAALQKKYAAAKELGFSKEEEHGKTIYEAKLENGAEKLEVSVDPTGKIVSEETQVAFESLPKEVKDAFAASKHGKWTVKKAEKIVEGEDASKVMYEIAITHGKQRGEVVYDAAGKLVKEDIAKGKADHEE